MKNLYRIALAAAIMLVGGNAFGQTAQDNGTANLSVTLENTYSITVGTPDVNITLATAADYVNGNSTLVTDHLTVTSTMPYSIEVGTSAANFTPSLGTGAADIAVSNVEVQILDGTASEGQIPLSDADVELLPATTVGAIDKKYNVNYIIPAAKAPNFLGKGEDIYTTTVTYTLVAE